MQLIHCQVSMDHVNSGAESRKKRALIHNSADEEVVKAAKTQKVERNPVECLRQIAPKFIVEPLDQSTGPRKVSSGQLEAYTAEKVNAIRNRDICKLTELLEQGQSFDACNNNAESLLHLACRRGDVNTVIFLIAQAKVSPDAIDSLGRSILHDICWRPEPDFELMDTVICMVSPELLIAKDARGHTPFDYVRRRDWAEWNQYLFSRKEIIQERLKMVV